MKSAQALLSLCVWTCLAQGASPTTFDNIVPTVVFLQGHGTATIVESNTIYEVWLKDPNTGKSHPRKQLIAGTGFLVSTDENHMYLA